MPNITIDNITRQQIEALRTDAGAHGDTETVRYCDVALDSQHPEQDAAITICATILANAELEREYLESLDD